MTESGSCTCSRCGIEMETREMAVFGSDRVCPDCVPHYRQSYREGVQPQAGWKDLNMRLPTFVMTMVIIDLVFCALRGIVAILGLVGIFVLQKQGKTDQLFILGIFEVLTGAGICFLGLPGNILILLKKKIGVVLAWGAVLATVTSLLVSIATVIVRFDQLTGGTAETVGFIVGGGFTMVLRLGLLIAYAYAVIKFRKWIAEKDLEQ